MAGCRREWSTDKLKYLEANYESCKLKVRQDSLHCKLFILEYQNRLEEEKRITLKYELKATRQQLKQAEEKQNEMRWKEQYIVDLANQLHILRKISQLQEANLVENKHRQVENKQKLDLTEENLGPLVQLDSETNDISNHIGDQIASDKTCCVVEPDLPANYSTSRALSKDKLSLVETTKEALKSSGKYSLYRKNQSQVCDVDAEGNKAARTQRLRRVTFNDELELKLADGTKEIQDMVICDDSDKELETSFDYWENEEPVHDVLAGETNIGVEGLDLGCISLEQDDVGGRDLKKMPGMETKNFREVIGGKDFDEFEKNNSAYAKANIICVRQVDSRLGDKRVAKEKETIQKKGSKTFELEIFHQSCCENNEKRNGKFGNEEDEDRTCIKCCETSSVEADILLSDGRQFNNTFLNLEFSHDNHGDIQTHNANGTVQCRAQNLEETGCRNEMYRCRRGLRKEARNEVKPSRLCFDDEPAESNIEKKTENKKRKKKVPRKTKRNNKMSNRMSINNLVNIPNLRQDGEKNVQNLDGIVEDEIDFKNQSDISQPRERSKDIKPSGMAIKRRKLKSVLKIAENAEHPSKGKIKDKKTTQKKREIDFHAHDKENCKNGNYKIVEHDRRNYEECNSSSKVSSLLDVNPSMNPNGGFLNRVERVARQSRWITQDKIDNKINTKEKSENGTEMTKKLIDYGDKDKHRKTINQRKRSRAAAETAKNKMNVLSKNGDKNQTLTDLFDEGSNRGEKRKCVANEEVHRDMNLMSESGDEGRLIEKLKIEFNKNGKTETNELGQDAMYQNYNKCEVIGLVNNASKEGDDSRGRKRGAADVAGNRMKATSSQDNKSGDKKDLVVDEYKENDDKEANKKGRKHVPVEMTVDSMKATSKHTYTSEEGKLVGEDEENDDKEANKGGRKHVTVETAADSMNATSKSTYTSDEGKLVGEDEENDDKEANKGGRKHVTVQKAADSMKATSKNTYKSEKGKVVDEDKENDNKEANKGGRKHVSVETAADSMKATSKNTYTSEEGKMGDEKLKNDDKKANKRGRKHTAVATAEDRMKIVTENNCASEEEKDLMIYENKENYDKEGNKRVRKRAAAVKAGKRMKAMCKNERGNKVFSKTAIKMKTKKQDVARGSVIKSNGTGKKVSGTENSTMVEQEIKNKRGLSLPAKTVTQKKPSKKRRTLYSSTVNATFFNTTNSIFQETLPLNQTGNTAGMPPALSSFMKSFIIPKLKKK